MDCAIHHGSHNRKPNVVRAVVAWPSAVLYVRGHGAASGVIIQPSPVPRSRARYFTIATVAPCGQGRGLLRGVSLPMAVSVSASVYVGARCCACICAISPWSPTALAAPAAPAPAPVQQVQQSPLLMQVVRYCDMTVMYCTAIRRGVAPSFITLSLPTLVVTGAAPPSSDSQLGCCRSWPCLSAPCCTVPGTTFK